ncbi:hypothetical protein P0D88_46545, partial [Paraburkholderia sp. RL18-103-BIB-C]|uniref:hypothetical protein n=1 Tax=Paraburkholderia sp. RL18-103-BIB-C TaxID=3031637 RepID=UPI0038BDE931
MSSNDAAAWVQAVGSILAIIFSVCVAVWQSRKAHEQIMFGLAQQRRADYLRVANTLIEIAKNALKLQKHVGAKLDTREAIYKAAEDR